MIYPIDKPITKTGGVVGLKGNLAPAGAIVKVAGIAAENQVFVVASNQTGVMGSLRFLGQAKVVGPGGEVLAATRSKGGIARVEVDIDTELARSRRVLDHLAERRPETYTMEPEGTPPCA